MARPRTPVGTWGEITCKEKRPGRWLAEAWFRERNGKLPRVTASGKTKTGATNALKTKLTKRAEAIRRGTINPDTRVARVAELWLESVAKGAEHGSTSWRTVANWRSWTRRWIVPACGELSMRELESDIGVIDDLLDRAMRQRSPATASGVKTAFGLLCEYAARHGALVHNPVRLAQRISGTGNRPQARGLTTDERVDLIAKVGTFAQSKQFDKRGRKAGRALVWQDLPDLCEALLSTGLRAGELCALVGANFDGRDKTLHVVAHIVRKPGGGLIRVPNRKGSGRSLLLQVPDWSVPMWNRRKLAAGEGPMFPTAFGNWRDPGHLAERFATAFGAIGYGWLKSHALGRKTQALALAEAGLGAGDIANQLGNTERVVQRHYLPPRPANVATIAALDAMLPTSAVYRQSANE